MDRAKKWRKELNELYHKLPYLEHEIESGWGSHAAIEAAYVRINELRENLTNHFGELRFVLKRARRHLERHNLSDNKKVRHALAKLLMLEYADNVRIAQISSPEQLEKYAEAQKQGCCGQADIVIEDSYRTFLLGVNYGH